MRFLYPVLSALILLSSCQKNKDAGPQPIAAKTEMNVAYGTDPLQKMDIYLPPGRSQAQTKLMVLIHGGGWNAGDKTDFAGFIDTLKRRLPDYAIFNINYRLATGPGLLFPTQENDVKAAIDFIYSRRTEYQVSDKFVLLGISAGAHLALLQAYKQATPVRIKAVVDFFGPTELVHMYNNPPNPLVPGLLWQVTGGTPASHPAVYFQSSPLNFVSSQSPPTIILHGGADIVVAASQSVMLQNSLQARGVIHQYVLYPLENHGWTGPNLSDSFDKIGAFLQAHVQ